MYKCYGCYDLSPIPKPVACIRLPSSITMMQCYLIGNANKRNYSAPPNKYKGQRRVNSVAPNRIRKHRETDDEENQSRNDFVGPEDDIVMI
jgi:hypothetical protein